MAAAIKHVTTDFANYPPLDPVLVASRFGAHVEFLRDWARDDGGRLIAHGRLKVRAGHWLIQVPAQTLPERRRFSIAHEIGHILLFDAVAHSPDFVDELRSKTLGKQVEPLCNLGAAHLLMPTAPFTAAALEALPPTQRSIQVLAGRFGVSLEAVARRIAEVQADWSVMFWEHTEDHPRGPGWRTAKTQHQRGRTFLPSGLSSSRLQPDIVEESALGGHAEAPLVVADIPGVARMRDARAWPVRGARPELVSVETNPDSQQKERVFMFYRDADQVGAGAP